MRNPFKAKTHDTAKVMEDLARQAQGLAKDAKENLDAFKAWQLARLEDM